MSRIGKKPVPVPPQVKVEIRNGQISVAGPKGQLTWQCPRQVQVSYDDQARTVTVTRANDERLARACHGLARTLIANMVRGVVDGYQKRLEVHGVGYQVKVQGQQLLLDVGFSGRKQGGKPAEFLIEIPAGLAVKIEQPTNPGRFVISGIDKQLVGQFAAEIRAIRPPDPYQAKGIRYEGEQIHRKQGKTAVGTGSQA